MPTHRSNDLPAPHESEGGLGWRWLAAECPSKCEERYIFGHTYELGETWKKNMIQRKLDSWMLEGLPRFGRKWISL